MSNKQIIPAKIYTLREVLDGGLLLKADGKPYKAKSQGLVRIRLRMAGIEPVYDSGRRQMVYKISGTQLIELNSACVQ